MRMKNYIIHYVRINTIDYYNCCITKAHAAVLLRNQLMRVVILQACI